MSNIDRRTFVLGAASALALPLWGCGGGGGSLPPVSSQSGPVAVTPQGAQFAALPMSHAVDVTSAQGTRVRIGGLGQGNGRFNYPIDVAVLGETAYVVEKGNHRVQAFDAKGNSLGMLGVGVLNYPGGIATAPGEILVSDSRNARIVGFDPQGNITRVLGEDTLSAPRGLTVLPDGSLLVADPGLRKVLILAANGSLQGSLGQWVLPYDVATDGQQVYVIDASANEVVALSMSGERVGAIPLERTPNYLSMRGGTLYVG
jgi:DNA-binding beta-propeller fold protein YncE